MEFADTNFPKLINHFHKETAMSPDTFGFQQPSEVATSVSGLLQESSPQSLPVIALPTVYSDRDISSAQQLKDVLDEQQEQGMPLLGMLMTYQVAPVRITTEELRLKAESAGYPTKYLPTPITKLSALKRAQNMVKGPLWRGGAIRLEEISQTDQQKRDKTRSIAVTQKRENPETEEVEVTQIDTIRFDEETGRLSSSYDHASLHSLNAAFHLNLSHGKGDVTDSVTKFINEFGVRIRLQGGVYFIPARFMEIANSCNRYLQSINPQSTLTGYQIFDTPQNLQEIQGHATSALAREFEQMVRSMKDIFERQEIRDSSIEKKNAIIRNFKTRIEMLQQQLGIQIDGLWEEVSQAETILGTTRHDREGALKLFNSAFHNILNPPTETDEEWAGVDFSILEIPTNAVEVEEPTNIIPIPLPDAIELPPVELPESFSIVQL
jgi:hypothetical protein